MRQKCLFVCILAVGSGCAHWEPETRPVPEVVAENPDKIMIVRRDHSTVIVVQPSVTDSLVTGLLGTPRGRVDRDSTVAVPLADVALFYKWDPGSTALAYGVGIGAAVLFVSGLWVLALQGGGT